MSFNPAISCGLKPLWLFLFVVFFDPDPKLLGLIGIESRIVLPFPAFTHSKLSVWAFLNLNMTMLFVNYTHTFLKKSF